MLALQPNRKKRTEKQYVQESRRVSPIFPAGKLDPHERPDFLLVADRGKIGIEVTELCRQEPRAEAGRLAKVPDKAKAICDRFRAPSRWTSASRSGEQKPSASTH
jgi:hypothetical protein